MPKRPRASAVRLWSSEDDQFNSAKTQEGTDGAKDEGSIISDALAAVAQLTALLQAKSQEAERLRTHLESIEQIAECCICLERPVSHAFTPCGHLFCCARVCDSAKLHTCPICQSQVETKTRLYGVVDALKCSGLELSSEPAPPQSAAKSHCCSSHGTNAVLTKVRGAFLQLEHRLKTGEQRTTQGQAKLSEFHESEICTHRSIVSLEHSLSSLERVLGSVELEFAFQQIREAVRRADTHSARLVANVMQTWSFSLKVQQAGCRALKLLEAAPRMRGSKASWARSTQSRVRAAVTQVCVCVCVCVCRYVCRRSELSNNASFYKVMCVCATHNTCMHVSS